MTSSSPFFAAVAAAAAAGDGLSALAFAGQSSEH